MGDVFAVRTARVEGLFGRVVSTDAVVGPTHGCYLVYLYRPGSARVLSNLLTPPLVTSRAPWSHGYFEFVESEPLLPGDYFEHHFFRDARGALYDELSRPAGPPGEPAGEWRLYDTVDSIERLLAATLEHSGPR